MRDMKESGSCKPPQVLNIGNVAPLQPYRRIDVPNILRLAVSLYSFLEHLTSEVHGSYDCSRCGGCDSNERAKSCPNFLRNPKRATITTGGFVNRI